MTSTAPSRRGRGTRHSPVQGHQRSRDSLALFVCPGFCGDPARVSGTSLFSNAKSATRGSTSTSSPCQATAISDSVSIPGGTVSRIIGRAGITIRRLETDHGCSVKVIPNTAGSTERVVVVGRDASPIRCGARVVLARRSAQLMSSAVAHERQVPHAMGTRTSRNAPQRDVCAHMHRCAGA